MFLALPCQIGGLVGGDPGIVDYGQTAEIQFKAGAAQPFDAYAEGFASFAHKDVLLSPVF